VGELTTIAQGGKVDEDEALFRRVRRGDLAAFDALYARYETALYAYLRAVIGDRRDAEEVLHDAFLATLEEGPDDLDPGGFRPWLYRVARNQALNRRRAASRRARAHEAAGEASESLADVASEPTGARALEEQELATALQAAVGRLPAPLGELYHLRTSGLSYEQMAAVVETPVGTVKSRMHQLVHVLREELRPWIAPE